MLLALFPRSFKNRNLLFGQHLRPIRVLPCLALTRESGAGFSENKRYRRIDALREA
jgi:hypothetical protein